MIFLLVFSAAGPVIEKIEIEVQVGERAAEKIVKVINMSEEEEILEDKDVLLKLKKILAPGLNRTAKSSSSSSSRSSSSRSSLSSSASAKSSSSSSSRPRSRLVDIAAPIGKASRRVSSSSSSSRSSVRSSSSSSRASNSRSSLQSSRRSSSSSSSRSSAMSKVSQIHLLACENQQNVNG